MRDSATAWPAPATSPAGPSGAQPPPAPTRPDRADRVRRERRARGRRSAGSRTSIRRRARDGPGGTAAAARTSRSRADTIAVSLSGSNQPSSARRNSVPERPVRPRIDRRADERERADELRPLHGERRRDLTAHRVRDEQPPARQELAELRTRARGSTAGSAAPAGAARRRAHGRAARSTPARRRARGRRQITSDRTVTLPRMALLDLPGRARRDVRGPRPADGGLVAELRERSAQVAAGGGEKALERHRSRGKLPARERIDRLVDPGSAVPRAECPRRLGHVRGSGPSAGLVTGIGSSRAGVRDRRERRHRQGRLRTSR